jgi:hypothetical protein
MITADIAFYFYEGSKVAYETDIEVEYKVNPSTGVVLCKLYATVSGSDTDVSGTYTMSTTLTDVDAETGTGTNPSDKILSQIEIIVVDYLEGITENASVTFS